MDGSAVVCTHGLFPHAHRDPSSRPAWKMSGPSTTMSGSTFGSDVATTRNSEVESAPFVGVEVNSSRFTCLK